MDSRVLVPAATNCRPDRWHRKASGSSWSIWSPTGRYGLSYQAMADRSGGFIQTQPFIPRWRIFCQKRIDQSAAKAPLSITPVLNGLFDPLSRSIRKRETFTLFFPGGHRGDPGRKHHGSHSEKRDIPFRPDAEPYTKRKLLSDLLCSD
jgi:hypothetical protein